MTVQANVQIAFDADDEADAERLVESWQLTEGAVVVLSISAVRTGTAGADGSVDVALPPGPPVVAPPPVAAFTYSPASPGTATEVTFDASSSTDAIAYTWDYGDGGIDSGMFVTHVFTHKGDNTVTLVVTGGDGTLTDQTSQTVTVA